MAIRIVGRWDNMGARRLKQLRRGGKTSQYGDAMHTRQARWDGSTHGNAGQTILYGADNTRTKLDWTDKAGMSGMLH
jgi:hypothetical protein